MSPRSGRKRHPFRGLAAGFFLGLGALILLVINGQAAFTSWVPYAVIFAGCLVFGVLLALFGPSVRKGRKRA